ncbi:MAG: hypothetical protein G8237_07320 [Magnetococcales bacterium]|nr:hypothetical protein [Magnetococcales bacterium]
MSTDAGGTIYAYQIDKSGKAQAIGWHEIRNWKPENGYYWLVSRPDGAETRRWLQSESGLEPEVVNTLFSNDNRPQSIFSNTGTLIALRAVNQSVSDENDDELTCVNIWVDNSRIITIRTRKILACDDVRNEIKEGEIPRDTGELFSRLVDRIMIRLAPFTSRIDHELDLLEDKILLSPTTGNSHHELSVMRHRIITARRFLVPQHGVLSSLYSDRAFWLSDPCKRQLREANSHINRAIEDINACREHAALLQDEIMARMDRSMNRTMKIVAVFTAFLLPMNAVTSLLGTNIEGIPGQAGTNAPYGFLFECLGLFLLMVVSYFVFKKLKWFDED